MEIRTTLSGNNWSQYNDITARGYCFDSEDNMLCDISLARHFDRVNDEIALRELLTHCNGIYSIIINKPHFKALAIDSTRIYPLFFRGDGAVSDNAYMLINQESDISATALDTYNAGGAPLEGQTLVDNIFQVKPSGYVVFEERGFRHEKYYDMLVAPNECKAKELDELKGVIHSAFRRTVKSAEGKQIIVPLSGGYDSRLVACMLKQLSCDNVICYTVGDESSFEVQNAREVAKKLNFKHFAIDISSLYNQNKITDNTDFEAYYRHMGNLCNFTYLFEYVAIKRLQELNVIDGDAVFIPGHSGDFWGGAYIRKSHIRTSDSIKKIASSIMYDIMEYNYCPKTKRTLEKSIPDTCAPHTAIQNFVMNYTLAHAINNSARVYEFFGYEARMPFWDREIMNFFKTISFSQYAVNRIYYTFAHSLFADYGVDLQQPEVNLSDIKKQWWKNRIKKRLPKNIATRFINKNNITNELHLCEPLIEELRNNTPHNDVFFTVNDIMKNWYLMKVKSLLASKSQQTS